MVACAVTETKCPLITALFSLSLSPPGYFSTGRGYRRVPGSKLFGVKKLFGGSKLLGVKNVWGQKIWGVTIFGGQNFGRGKIL